jgi:hypothetical protein
LIINITSIAAYMGLPYRSIPLQGCAWIGNRVVAYGS